MSHFRIEEQERSLLDPVAILVKSNTEPHLAKLNDELERVREKLEQEGFQVEIVNESKPQQENTTSELLQILHKHYGRIALFHYMGHSTREGFETKHGTQSYKKLIELLKKQPSLRLLVLNSCYSKNILEQLKGGELKNAAFVVADGEIDDEIACKIINRFYSGLLEKSYSVEDSLIHAESALSESNERSSTRMSPHLRADDSIPNSWHCQGEKSNSLVDFRLALWIDFVRHEQTIREVNRYPIVPALFYLLIAIAASLSAYFSHIKISSPAFQTAFGYAPDWQFQEGFFSPIYLFTDQPGISIDEVDKKKTLEAIVEHPPKFGAISESVRAIILCSFAYLICFVIYNPLKQKFGQPLRGSIYKEARSLFLVFRSQRERLSRKKRERTENPKEVGRCLIKLRPPLILGTLSLTLALFVTILHKTVEYNLDTAPTTLEQKDPRWLRVIETEKVQHNERIWRNADHPSDLNNTYWKDSYLELQCENFHEPPNESLKDALFNRPYRAYLTYSICMFCLVAFPILLSIFFGTLRSFLEIKAGSRLFVQTISRLPADYQEEKLKPFLHQARLSLIRNFERFLQASFLICIAAFYEIVFGFYTLAGFAIAMTTFAFFLIISASFIYQLIRNQYTSCYRACERITSTDFSEREWLEEYQPSSFLNETAKCSLLYRSIFFFKNLFSSK